MQYVKDTIYNAYCGVWNYFYSVKDYECDPVEAQNKLKVFIMISLGHIQEKSKKLQEEYNILTKKFIELIQSDQYNETTRVDFSRKIADKENDLHQLEAIRIQILTLQQHQTQLITMRKDQEYLKKDILPVVENLIFASSKDWYFDIKLKTFNEFITFLWGKEYVISETSNYVNEDFRKKMTKIPVEEDFERICEKISSSTFIPLSQINRSKIQ